ncbi:DUF3347 domain-containing protein [Rhodohalobacter sp. SW132]|uniref:DUF3347 domain-containing protein n=1 Tax=Rhodohalobacter sp. SW132 TaxID=2293433 RepID=UPI000E383704|nr:DUF3347 domain-containing protein [Rhodohalobacter sp. SW132]REL38994.1 DUF3347 domain-containing protein [Rhodohalobacter sp. SW132]
MKNLIITSISTLVIAALFMQPSIAQDHAGHHDESEKVEQFNDVPEEFQASFTEVFEAYITGKDALLESDLEASITSFEEFINKLEAIGEHGLSGDGHMAWMESYSKLERHVSTLTAANNMDEARIAFQHLSVEITEAVKTFGINGVVYHQYCPMANDNDGAVWLSSREEVQNPYSPETMPGCGQVIERIES